MIELPTLYKRTSNRSIQQWQISVLGNTYGTVEGLLNGKLTKSLPTVCYGKNQGKKNETSNNSQALKEAQAKFDKKLKEGYWENIEDIDKVTFIQPMLAQEMNDRKKLLFTVPTYISVKLDGIRAVLNKGKLYSRKGNQFFSCPHLEFDCPYILDGELYSHKYHNDFNEIVSIVKKETPSQEELEVSKKIIQYYVYDIVSDLNYSERFKLLYAWWESLPMSLRELIVPVASQQVYTETQIQIQHQNIISEGFEGSIIRLDLGGYEHKRSKQLLKNKDWKEEDFEILDMEEGKGNRTGACGKLVVKVNDTTCEVSPTGTLEFMKQLWIDKDKLIGQKASVKFFNYTPDGKLRFPTLKTIRDYE